MDSVLCSQIKTGELFDGENINLLSLFKFNQNIGTDLYVKQGVFRKDLLTQGCVIVYTDIYFELLGKTLGDTLTAVTSFTGRKGIRTARRLYLFNEQDEPVLQMDTHSVYMNFETRRVAKPLNELLFVPARNFEKKPFLKMPEGTPLFGDITVTEEYTDVNLHTNNASYAAFIDQMLTEEQKTRLCGMGIKYVKESLLGDTLNIYHKNEENLLRIWGKDDGHDCFESYVALT